MWSALKTTIHTTGGMGRFTEPGAGSGWQQEFSMAGLSQMGEEDLCQSLVQEGRAKVVH